MTTCVAIEGERVRSGRLLLLLALAIGLLVVPLSGSSAQESARGITLDEAIALALERNPIMQAVQRQVDVARVQYEFADVVDSLRVNANASVSSIQPLPSIQGVTLGEPIQRQLSLQLNQPLFTGPVKRIAEDSARSSVDLAQHKQAATEVDLVLAVKRAYFGVLEASSIERVASESLDRAKAHLRVAQAREEAGTAAHLEVIQAQVDVADAEHQLLQAQGAVQQAQNALNNLLGLPAGTRINVADVKDLPDIPSDENKVVQQALSLRPELAQIRSSINLAQLRAKALSKQDDPQFALSATSSYQRGTSFQHGLTNTLVLGMTFPISDGGLIRAQRHEALRQAEQLEAQHEVVKRSVDLEVRQALVSLRVARDQLRLAEAGLEQAQEAFRVSMLAYANGVGAWITVKDARLGLTAAESRVVQSIYEYRVAFAQLERSVGVRRLANRFSGKGSGESEGDRGEADGRASP